MTYEEFINNEVLQVEKEKPLPKYPIIIEAMKVFLLFAGAVSIVSYAAYYSGGFDAVLYTLPLYVQPWITTFVRRRFSKVVLDAALFVIFAAWLLLSPALVVTLLAGAYMLAVTAYQIVREFSESEERERAGKEWFTTILPDYEVSALLRGEHFWISPPVWSFMRSCRSIGGELL